MVVLSSTLFPVPEWPTTEMVSPRAHDRSTPASTGWSKAFHTSRYSTIVAHGGLERHRLFKC
jgi:hypothetical protein